MPSTRFVVAAACLIATPVLGQSVQLVPNLDNTLYDNDQGSFSNAKGVHLFVGTTLNGEVRRGLMAFDIAGTIPAGSTITSVSLQMSVNRIAGTTGNPIELRRTSRSWGEGTSNAGTSQDGIGVASTPGDATWLHAFYTTELWSSPGGDFASAASATTNVTTTGTYNWSGPGMVADVQAWLDNPQSNFGWTMIGDESRVATAKRFGSRENTNSAVRPILTVQYIPAPGVLGLAGVGLLAWSRRRR